MRGIEYHDVWELFNYLIEIIDGTSNIVICYDFSSESYSHRFFGSTSSITRGREEWNAEIKRCWEIHIRLYCCIYWEWLLWIRAKHEKMRGIITTVFNIYVRVLCVPRPLALEAMNHPEAKCFTMNEHEKARSRSRCNEKNIVITRFAKVFWALCYFPPPLSTFFVQANTQNMANTKIT